MAKKRRDESEKKTDFKIPKFDKEKFIKKQQRNIKTLFISFLFGILIGILSSFIWVGLEENLRWILTFVFGFFSAAWLKYIFVKLKIDLKDCGKKEWFGSYAIYFFTWIVVLMLLLNPPFYDVEKPTTDIVFLPGMQEVGGTVEIVGYVADNTGIKNINFSITTPSGEILYPSFNLTNNIFSCTYRNNKTGQYLVNIIATDNSNLQGKFNGSFSYDNDTLRIASTLREGLGSGDIIRIKADGDISSEKFRVYYTLNNETEINANKTGNFYQSSPIYEGWKPNSNFTLRLYAEVVHYIHTREYNNTVKDTKIYNFSTSSDEDIGSLNSIETEDLNLPKADEYRATPGFEGITLLIAIIGVLLFFKYKRERN